MAYVLLALGGLLLYLEYEGTVLDAGALLRDEVFNGPSPFWKWLGALIIVGAIGYIPELEDVAFWFLTLILISIVLSHKSGFNALLKGL